MHTKELAPTAFNTIGLEFGFGSGLDPNDFYSNKKSQCRERVLVRVIYKKLGFELGL
jgi:hypothetical protein